MMHLLIAGQSDGGGNAIANALMAAGVAMLIILAIVNMRKMRRRQGEALNPHEKVERIKQSHGMKNDLRDMMVELEDLTRRFGAQLDAKAVRLERLIDEADARIAKLNATRSPTDHTPHSAHGNDSPASRTNGTATDAVADETPNAAAGGGNDPTEPEEPLDPLTREVYELADAGREPMAIARQLNEHVGKVELILALRES